MHVCMNTYTSTYTYISSLAPVEKQVGCSYHSMSDMRSESSCELWPAVVPMWLAGPVDEICSCTARFDEN